MTTLKLNAGNDFNLALGKFTCSIEGIYSFNFHISFGHNTSPVVSLKKNGVQIVSVYKDAENRLDIASNGAILQLYIGDTSV